MKWETRYEYNCNERRYLNVPSIQQFFVSVLHIDWAVSEEKLRGTESRSGMQSSSTSPAMCNMYTGKIYAGMEVTVIRGPMKQNYGAVMDTSVSKDGAISVVVHIETRIPPCVICFPEDDVLERL